MYRNSLLALFIVISYSIYGQKYPIKKFTVGDGLNSNSALCAFQNDDQKLWIGTTQGINIYDGIQFNNAPELFDLQHKVVYSIKKHGDKIHIGTNGGLCVYDGDSLRTYPSTDNGISDFIYTTFQDKNGTIWTATETGIKVFTGSQLIDTLVHTPLKLIAIYNIHQDEDGTMWFCSKMNGLFKYKNNKIEVCNLYEPLESEINFVAKVNKINDTTHWVCARKGLYEVTPNSSRRIDSIGGLNIRNVGFFDFIQTSNNELILSGTNGSIYIIKEGEKTLELNNKNGLTGGNVIKIFEDKEGTIWFLSPQKGVSQLLHKKMKLFDKYDLYFNGIDNIVKENDSSYYFVSRNNGIIKHCSSSGSFDTLKVPDSFESDPHIKYYSAIFSPTRSLLMVGTNNGLLTFKNDALNSFHSLTVKPYETFKIYDLAEGKSGIIWLATSHGIYFVKDDGIQKLNDKLNINIDMVSCVTVGKNGTIYFGTNLGLIAWNNQKLVNLSQTTGLKTGQIRQIKTFNDSSYWIASDKGLFKCINNELMHYELPGYEKNIIHSFEFDLNKNLWIGLSDGLIRVTELDSTKKIRFFSKESGFLGGGCNSNSMVVSKDNQLFVGTDEGLLVVNAADTFESKSTYFPILDISVLGTENIDEYTELEKDGRIQSVTLPNSLKNFKISFKGIHLLAGKELKFMYRLEGENEKVKVVKNDFEINYSQVSFGDYVVKIKPQPHPNLIHQKEHTILVTIKKPFYLQWWFILLCILILLTWVYSYILIHRNVKLLNEQKFIILEQKKIVEVKNHEILDSITYAKRIQEAILPSNRKLSAYFEDFFVLYKPRDIVSGDFYWVEEVDEYIVFAAADCTGHGVPGAMVNLMCNNLLRKAIVEEKIIDPGKALDRVSELLLELLESENGFVSDGMDLALCVWNKKTNELNFSGANQPFYLICNGELNITKPNKQPIGYFEDKTSFTTHNYKVSKGDQIILFTDGYKDQFGGIKGKKIGIKRFNNLLLKQYSKSLNDQKKGLHQELNEWMENEDQVDDICIFSIKI